MVDEVQYYATLARDTGEDALNEEVIASLGTVERHEFVPVRQIPFAYDNRPLPIGHGQTISQPYIVATSLQHASSVSAMTMSRRNSLTATTAGKSMHRSTRLS